MTCKEKKSTLVLSQPHVQITILQVFLVTGTSGHLGQAAFQAGATGADIAGRPTRVEHASPLLPALWLPACAFSQLSPPAQALLVRPGSSWGMHAYTPCPRGSGRGRCRKTKDSQRAPIPQRQPMTPQKKTSFPSVSHQMNGRWGPSCSSNPEYQKGTIST